MRIYKDSGTISGFRYESPLGEHSPVAHAGEYWSSRHHFVPAHSHQVWEFLYQAQGHTIWQQAGRRYRVEPGQLLICPPRLPHGMAEEARNEFRICFLGTSLEDECGQTLAPWLPRDRLLLLGEAHPVQPYLFRLLEEIALDRPYRSRAVLLAREQIVIATARLLPAIRMQNGAQDSHWLGRIKTLMREMPGEPWKLETMARLAGYSTGYFSDQFREATGQSPHAFLLEVRVAHARELLTVPGKSITEIAHELGFSSSQHFATAFRRLTGHTPLAYRNQYCTGA
jgi:AraC-like DNA-binding protein